MPTSGTLFDLIPRFDSTVEAESVSVARFVIDTLGVTTDIHVVCSPSQAASERVVALVEGAVFSPARERGRPVQLPMMLPVVLAPEGK